MDAKKLLWKKKQRETAGYRVVQVHLSFVDQSGPSTHATREAVAKTPYFFWKISCLAVIMGETRDSGLDPGWDVIGNIITYPNDFRESWGAGPGIAIRADNGGVVHSRPVEKKRRSVESDRFGRHPGSFQQGDSWK